ncbi:hypothetical protein IFR05_009369 [Cadophora sp. M221]|nr:hypothetical protein IFR05_009369 [Cadophora sp. M221]
MSSSRGKQKKSKKSASSNSTSNLSTGWTEWEWEIDRACWKRWRMDEAGQYDIEYDPPQQSGEPSAAVETSTEPRITPQLNTAALVQSGPPYQASEHYTTSSSPAVEGLTNSFPQLAISTTTLSYSQSASTQQPSTPTHIRTRNPDTDREEFNPHYKVHQPWEFKWGRVFKVMWAEPKGAGAQEDSDASYTQRQTANGGTDFQKVRRFIIINPMRGHCVIADHHTIVFSEKKAVYAHGEKVKGLTKKPIRISCSTRHKLDELSRMNYAKTYTVEYNVKVCFIGKVDKKSEWQLTADYNIMHPPLKHNGTKPDDDEEDNAGGIPASQFNEATTGIWDGTDRSGEPSSSSNPQTWTPSYTPHAIDSSNRQHEDIEEEQEDTTQAEYVQDDPEETPGNYAQDGGPSKTRDYVSESDDDDDRR